MLVETWPIDRPKPYPHNPRQNDDAVDAVMASLREFGFRQPLVVDEHDVLIVGHTRLKAARKLGLKEVPVHVARGLSPEQARAYRLADNRTASIATWDDDQLALELIALRDADFDLALTGFAEDELLAHLTAGESADGNVQGDPDHVPEPPAEPVTKPGDLWALGRHRLLCGDATQPSHLARLLPDTPADVLLTDPPYNVAYEGKTQDALTIANDDMDPEAYRAFLTAALTCAGGRLKPGGAFYVWHADLMGLDVRLACAAAGLRVRQCLIWVKSSLVLGRQDYHWKHEICLYGWSEGAAHTWFGDRTRTTVLEYDKPAKNPDHPTPKPVELFAELLQNSCPKGGTVLDPFAGSGTALAAAETTGRTAALVELDPRYCDVVLSRYIGIVGAKARVRLQTSQGEIPHEDVCAMRSGSAADGVRAAEAWSARCTVPGV